MKSRSEEHGCLTIFRTDKDSRRWLCNELCAGRLRQGWGANGMELKTLHGTVVQKEDWESSHHAQGWGAPSPRRYAILRRMLDMESGSIVVVPKMPERHQFTIARVEGKYRFDPDPKRRDFGHVVPVDKASVRTFDNQADEDAYLVSGLFSRANHWSAVSFSYGEANVAAAGRLLQRESVLAAKPASELDQLVVDRAFLAGALSLRKAVMSWNAHRFEEAVREAFRKQGYEVKRHRRFDGEGADADMLVAPSPNHGLFLPGEMAVQVKWKQGVDESDVQAVEQIVQWTRSEDSNAARFVISSAAGFTPQARKAARAHDVGLIGGLQTMCFLLGVPEVYREDWEYAEEE